LTEKVSVHVVSAVEYRDNMPASIVDLSDELQLKIIEELLRHDELLHDASIKMVDPSSLWQDDADSAKV